MSHPSYSLIADEPKWPQFSKTSWYDNHLLFSTLIQNDRLVEIEYLPSLRPDPVITVTLCVPDVYLPNVMAVHRFLLAYHKADPEDPMELMMKLHKQAPDLVAAATSGSR